MIALSQERDECHFGRDGQRSRIVFGQKCLEAGEQGVVRKPLHHQGGGVAAPGERTAAGGERAPAARSCDFPFIGAIAL
jgi:hypothetical protein